MPLPPTRGNRKSCCCHKSRVTYHPQGGRPFDNHECSCSQPEELQSLLCEYHCTLRIKLCHNTGRQQQYTDAKLTIYCSQYRNIGWPALIAEWQKTQWEIPTSKFCSDRIRPRMFWIANSKQRSLGSWSWKSNVCLGIRSQCWRSWSRIS